jgi:hypothetical protein
VAVVLQVILYWSAGTRYMHAAGMGETMMMMMIVHGHILM